MITDSEQKHGGFWNLALAGERRWIAAAWYLTALLSTLWVLLVNGAPLYYYDTGGYLIQGDQFLKLLGLLPEQPVGNGVAGGGAEAAGDDTVQGNRSLIYGIVLSTFQKFANLSLAVVAQSSVLIFTLWMCVRLVLRRLEVNLSVAAATGISVLAASLGSAPFYTAYLMPDIFAPVLILSLSALSALIGSMRVWEIAGFVVLAAAAVVMHPSHLIMAILFVPLAPIVAWYSGRGRVLLSVLLVASVSLVGVLERFAFTVAAEKIAKSEVIYQPFLTARLIADGPGINYLREVCPKDDLVTCDLLEMFVRLEHISASHILFETSEELGSFRLLPEETQKRIVQEQGYFLLSILKTRPINLIGSVVRNFLTQLVKVSVNMTLPDGEVLQSVEKTAPEASVVFAGARLTGWRDWLPKLAPFQYSLYLLSAAVLLAAVFRFSRGAERQFQAFLLIVVVGILINAFVLGAISQPANRYGARVILLLPMLAALSLLIWRRSGPKAVGHAELPNER